MLKRCTLFIACASGIASAQSVPPGFVDSLVRGGWEQAVGVVFAADGRAFVWEKAGRVWMIEAGETHDHPVIDISDEARDWRDFGLLGVALDPHFLDNGRIYLSYIVDYHHLAYFGTPQYDPSANDFTRDSIGRVTRFELDAADDFHTMVAGSRTVLIGESASTGIPITHQSHSMGAMVFGEDGTLLIAAGDGASYDEADNGGTRTGSSNTALADGILAPFEDVGALRAQMIDSHSGKVLRIDPDTGDGVSSNPYYDQSRPRAPRSRVWTLGNRNPFRMTLRPGTGVSNPAAGDPGTLYIGDVGWLTYEELNVVPSGGGNYGWPLFEGLFPNSNFQLDSTQNPLAPNPLAGAGCGPFVPFRNLLIQETLGPAGWPNPCDGFVQLPGTLNLFEHARPAIEWGRGMPFRCAGFSGNDAVAINVGAPGAPVAGTGFIPNGTSSTGGAWYTGGAFPAAYRNSYYHADFVGRWIHQFLFDASDRPVEVRSFATGLGSIVDVEYNPFDQSLYYVAFADDGTSQLRRISYGLDAPPTAAASPRVSFGPLPLTVQFVSTGSSDPEGAALTYFWDFGDGQTSSDPNPVHTFEGGTAPQRFDVVFTVRDPAGNSATQRLLVSGNNTPPQVTITSPVNGSFFPNGTFTQPLRADVIDAEHSGSALSCRWQAQIRHNTHAHPEPAIVDCAPDVVLDGAGHSGETFYWEFRLTVTDAAGLSTVASSSVFPQVLDCNGNGVPDSTDIELGSSNDCNGNLVPDECAILLGQSNDCNGNLVPDDCDSGTVRFYALGGGPQDFRLNGTALWDNGRIRLTAPNPIETGSAVLPLTDGPVYGFDVSFDMTMGGPVPGRGLCFAVMDTVYSQLSNFGLAGPGYGALTVAFEPRSGGLQDRVTVSQDTLPIATGTVPFEIADGQPHRVRVRLTPLGVEVSIADSFGTPSVVVPRTVVPLWRVGQRYLAFGAGTDDALGVHAIDNVNVFIAGETDHNGDAIPDVCQPLSTLDCDGDGTEDWAAITSGAAPDCNANLRPDSCDIAIGASLDTDQNGVPDECDPCLADYDDNGGIDGDDVIAFFADWDNGILAADVDGSGGVDGDDVILFFTQWDSGC
ncbi:MAG: PQQ-dependent sugar dehydrogenase [Phycisphaerales bacterium]